jgi:hypothetical protein
VKGVRLGTYCDIVAPFLTHTLPPLSKSLVKAIDVNIYKKLGFHIRERSSLGKLQRQSGTPSRSPRCHAANGKRPARRAQVRRTNTLRGCKWWTPIETYGFGT